MSLYESKDAEVRISALKVIIQKVFTKMLFEVVNLTSGVKFCLGSYNSIPSALSRHEQHVCFSTSLWLD